MNVITNNCQSDIGTGTALGSRYFGSVARNEWRTGWANMAEAFVIIKS